MSCHVCNGPIDKICNQCNSKTCMVHFKSIHSGNCKVKDKVRLSRLEDPV